MRRYVIFSLMLLTMLLFTSCNEQDSQEIFRQEEDLHGKSIAVHNGSTFEHFLSEEYSDSDIKVVQSALDIPMMVSTEKCDGGLMSALIWDVIKDKYPNVVALESNCPVTQIAFAFNKDHKDLLDKFNEFMAEYKSKPEFKEMVEAWKNNPDSRDLSIYDTPECTEGCLEICGSPDYEPYLYIKNGNTVGIESEIIHAFAHSLNMKCRFTHMYFASIIPYLQSGKAQIAASTISVTEERKKTIDFSEPWLEEPGVMLIHKKNAAEATGQTIKSINDLHGKRIVTVAGSTQDIYLTDVVKDCQVVRVESIADMYIALSQNKADALLTSSITWIQERQEYPNMVCITDTISPFPIGVAFNKNENQLREQFNQFLSQYLKSDTYIQSFTEWSLPNSERKMPVFSDEECPNGSLTVAVAPLMCPFAYMKDGQISGIEMEMIARFGRAIGKRVVFVNMPFGAVIPTLASGKAQMAADIICITEERCLSVDFSDPWTYESMALVVNPNQSGTFEDNSFSNSIKNSFYNNFIKEKRYKLILNGLWMTILISIMSAFFGTILGILLCIGMKSSHKLLSKSCSVYVDFMRCMPQVVFLMIMFYIVFGKTDISGTSVAIVAFSMCFGAYTSIIFKSVLEGIDKGQTEAGLSMGFSRFKTASYFIIPQMVQRAIPIYKNEFIGLVKATSIVGYITVFDLTRAGDIIRSRTYEAFFPLIVVTLIYFIVIWVLSFALKYAEIKTQPKRKKFFK